MIVRQIHAKTTEYAKTESTITPALAKKVLLIPTATQVRSYLDSLGYPKQTLSFPETTFTSFYKSLANRCL